jgi:exopolysaccharide biosynthesis polyprenyl glycosylphosphotransferase
MRGVPLYGTDIAHFFSHEVALLRVRNNLRRWPARLTKRLFDTFTAATLLVLVSPVMLLIALALKIEGGNVLFAHQRIGKNGRKFYCYKFRSMVPNAEQQLQLLLQQNPSLNEEWRKEHKLKDDPRISKLGDFLRRNSLDELPQLFNVLCGSMSLVGPRPHAVVHNELYRRQISGYMVRHKVRPGITGWAQVHGLRGETDTIDKMEARVRYDLEYLSNWSLVLDFKILLKTLFVVVGQKNAY